MDIIDTIISEQPTFHRGETEISRNFEPMESLLSYAQAEEIAMNQPACYGIGIDVANFIRSYAGKTSRTLEIGAGISTLIFAIGGSLHTSITPNSQEIEEIRSYANSKCISLEKVTFINEYSEYFLPQSGHSELDMVLVDGKHAFPWPIVDWFYTADKLKIGGIMLVDDAQMMSVRILVDFMNVDPGWKYLISFNDKTFTFRKNRKLIHDVAWHMQPYIVNNLPSKKKRSSVVKRYWSMLKSLKSYL